MQLDALPKTEKRIVKKLIQRFGSFMNGKKYTKSVANAFLQIFINLKQKEHETDENNRIHT